MTSYNAEISAGSLLPLESRRIATLLLSKPEPAAWQHAIEVENILQKKTPATARRQARLLQRRLTTLDAQAWQMMAERESEVVIQLLLAASCYRYPAWWTLRPCQASCLPSSKQAFIRTRWMRCLRRSALSNFCCRLVQELRALGPMTIPCFRWLSIVRRG